MLPIDPQWYKDAIIYELHVRSYCDSAGEGTGNFKGLREKLGYLQDLGITAIWLLPFYPSPLRDDGYDIADYTSVNPDYGTLDDFREFLDAAHDRGLRVITELVINHTSDQHPWFQRARRAPAGSSERNFYVWSNSPLKYPDARIIFRDFESSNWSFDNVAKAYYWHRFYSHQPDLNFDNPDVWDALMPVVDFWFEKGVDGVRLDAIPYLYEREGTNCENLPETHAFLKALRHHVDERFPGRMLLAEANQWPEDSVAYFGDGDECHMAFHFPIMPRLFMAIHREDRLPVVDIIEQTPALPEGCQWALFLRNHDELTLEMVTDEERDYMYEAYASDPRARINLGIRHRLAPLLGNNRRRIELMNGLLFSLPGTPVLYYGDEIGMGDNIYLGDRNGVRTPMQWSADRNAGFSRANPQKLFLPVIIDPEYHYEAVNVEAQQANLNSLLWWNKRLIALRRHHPALSRGSLEFLRPLNRRVLAFLRRHDDETILVVANLSRFAQWVELDLAAHAGLKPVELFGMTPFPTISDSPYVLMLGPHSFLWFSLKHEPQRVGADHVDATDLPRIRMDGPWEHLKHSRAIHQFEQAVQPYIQQRLLRQSSRNPLRRVRIREVIPFALKGEFAFILIFDAEIGWMSTVRSWLPIVLVSNEGAASFDQSGLIAKCEGAVSGTICDATLLPEFNQAIVEFVQSGRRAVGQPDSEIVGVPASTPPLAGSGSLAHSKRNDTVASGRSITFDEACVLSCFSRPESSKHPECELGRWLTDTRHYSSAPKWLGNLEYRRARDNPLTLATLSKFIPNEGSAWQFTLDELSAFFDRTLILPENYRTPPVLAETDFESPESSIAPAVMETLGGFLNSVRLMAARLASLHEALSCETSDTYFDPERMTGQYQRSLYQTMRSLVAQTISDLRQFSSDLTHDARVASHSLYKREPEVFARFHRIVECPLGGWRIRIHGECHLANLLRTGKDFALVGFGGSVAEAERKSKRSPLFDVARMLHSFDFAASAALNSVGGRHGRTVGNVRPEDYETLAQWCRFWTRLIHEVFVNAYRAAVEQNDFLAVPDADFDVLIDVFLLQAALVELRSQVADGSPAIGIAVEMVSRYLDEPWHDRFTASPQLQESLK